ncbi:MAG: D-alanyl-D-alanine carboxypeptidase [Erysipelotrichales bacterium]|nr:D-alanyl-D-alanine carboxypeptidase [Erysipelotrichales bacterium]
MRKVLLIVIILCIWSQSVCADNFADNAKSAYLIEYNSEKVLFSKNEEERLYPASMTKMMSLYLIFEAIQNGKLKINDIVTVSEHAAGMGGSQIWLQVNEQMSVDDLL